MLNKTEDTHVPVLLYDKVHFIFFLNEGNYFEIISQTKKVTLKNSNNRRIQRGWVWEHKSPYLWVCFF